jgi:hypothetical protein
MVGDQIASSFNNIGFTGKEISSREIKARRPKVKGLPSEEIVAK